MKEHFKGPMRRLDEVELTFVSPNQNYPILNVPNEKFILPFEFAWPKLTGDAELMINQIMVDLLNPQVMQTNNDSVRRIRAAIWLYLDVTFENRSARINV